MNLLPFVVIFIFVISLTTTSLFSQYRNTNLAHLAFSGKMHAHQNLRDTSEKAGFSDLATEHKQEAKRAASLPPKPELVSLQEKDPEEILEIEPTPSKQSSKKSFRERNFTDNSLLNLSPLLEKDDPFLSESIVKLFDTLYGHVEYYQKEKKRDERFTKQFVQQLLSALRLLPQDENAFTQVHFDSEEYNFVWYKLLKGTPDYNLKEKIGWPPITDIVMLDTNDKKVLHIQKTMIPILEVFFGSDTTTAFLDKEQEKREDPNCIKSILKKDEVNSILSAKNQLHLTDYIDYGTKSGRTHLQGKDKKSGIRVSTKLPKSDKKGKGAAGSLVAAPGPSPKNEVGQIESTSPNQTLKKEM